MKLFLIAVLALLLMFTGAAMAEDIIWYNHPDGYWKLLDVEMLSDHPENIVYNAAEGEVSATGPVKCLDHDQFDQFSYMRYDATASNRATHTVFPNQAEDRSELNVTISLGASVTCEPGDELDYTYLPLDFYAVGYAHGYGISSPVDLYHDTGHFDIPRSWGTEASDDYTYTFPSFWDVWTKRMMRDGTMPESESDKYNLLVAESAIPNKYFFEYLLSFETIGGTANVTYKYVWVPKGAGETITGRAVDFDGRPLAYAKLQVTCDGKRYDETTGQDGSYSITMPTLDLESQKEVTIRVYLDYLREGTTYFKIFDEKSGGWIVYLQKTLILSGPEDLVQNFDFGFAFKDNYNLEETSAVTGDGVKYSSRSTLRTLRDAAAIYYNLHDAVDVYLTILDANLNYKLPVDVTINSADGSQYLKANSDLLLSEQHTPYTSVHRRFVEQHEFSHHALYSQYGASWPEGRSLPNMTNHGGYLNPSSADSFTEGFAEFMTLVIASYSNVPNPEYYSNKGSFENNLRVWSNRGKMEEYAVASLLWDLYDDHSDKGDSITLSMPQIWSVLKTKRKDFQAYYKAFTDAFPDKRAEIDAVFVEHGFFADKNTGNGVRDDFEPFRDTIKNGANNGTYNLGEYFVDYGAYETGRNMFYDPGEEVGRPTQYTRPDRGYDDYIPDAFLKVSDTGADLYTVSIHFNDPQDGDDYSYMVDRRQGMIYVMPLPEQVDATISVRPAQGYTAQNVYTITNEEYITKYYASEGKGYFDEHTFGLSGAGPSEEYWPNGIEPPLIPDGGYDSDGSVEARYDELPGVPAAGTQGVGPVQPQGATQIPSGSQSPGAQPLAGGDSGLLMILIALVLILAVVVVLIVVLMKKPHGTKPTQFPAISYATTQTTAAPSKFCRFCGQRVEAGVVLCPKCGAAQLR